jgi:hypothetical protein
MKYDEIEAKALVLALVTILANIKTEVNAQTRLWIAGKITNSHYASVVSLYSAQERDIKYLLEYPYASTYTDNKLYRR